MAQTRRVRVSVVVLTCLLIASPAWAQQSTSGIAGVVRDTSGGVLPGVTVEATSPALIERVRSVVTDGEGRYNIVALPPGTYAVTFTLAGFNTLRREGIVLTAGFTAPVNVDLPVGALEETLTVTGEAPLVDTQNIRQQSQISEELLTILPSSKGITTIISFTPGVQGQQDVGGSGQAGWASQGGSARIRYHGKAGLDQYYDGFGILAPLGVGLTGFQINPYMVQEIVVAKGMGSSETNNSMLTFNAIPKEGSNTFNYTVSGIYSNHNMQGNNLDDALRAQGVRDGESVRYVYTIGGSAGGPIRRDKVWFHSSVQRLENKNHEANNYFNKTHPGLIYTPDFDRPAEQHDENYRVAGRVTWQAARRHKLNFGAELQKIWEHRQRGGAAPEATENYRHRMTLLQSSWNSPVSDKLLFEAGASSAFWALPTFPQPEVPDPLNTPMVIDLALGNYRFNNRADFSFIDTWRRSQRFAVSYVTGSHAFKVGVLNEQIRNKACRSCNGPQSPISYEVRRGVPVNIVQYATPYTLDARIKAELGIFAQDQWAIRRFTFNYGVRFDYFNGHVDEQTIAATRFIPERHFDEVKNVPRWTDVNPRLGIAYDLFGNGRTALKFGFGRYLVKDSIQFVSANNPINTAVNAVKRNWTDANGDHVPDCNLNIFTANGECGPISDAAFGQQRKITTRYDKNVREGFGVRPANWDMSVEVQHQLTRALSITGGFYRTSFTHGGTGLGSYVTDNLQVTQADYDPFCITAPVDPRLPNGGGYQICGLYDIKPAKFGLVDNVVAQPSDYGKPVQVSEFFGVNVSTRFASGLLVNGGLDTGRITEDTCFVVDSPQALLHCRVVTPFQTKTQVKVQASYPLPREFTVSAVFQNTPGPIYSADYSASNAEIAPSLGRNLAACGTRAVCTASVTVPLIIRDTHSEARFTQLDVRVSKILRFGNRIRLQANLDIYNALNSNDLLNVIGGYGPRWRQPGAGGSSGTLQGILGPRLLQIGGELDF